MWFFVTGDTIGTWKCYSQLQRSPECRETRQRMRNEEKDWLFCIYVCTFLRLLKMPSCYSHWHLILDNFLWCFFKKYFIETFWRFFLKCSENFLKTFLYIKRKTFNVFKIVEAWWGFSKRLEMFWMENKAPIYYFKFTEQRNFGRRTTPDNHRFNLYIRKNIFIFQKEKLQHFKL